MTEFDLLHPRLKEYLLNNTFWFDLTVIQKEVFSAILNYQNTLVIAPTAAGKTEAVLLPLITKLLTTEPNSLILYIAPLRALLNDLYKRSLSLFDNFGLKVALWNSDVPSQTRLNSLIENPSILFITPESLELLLQDKLDFFFPHLKRIRVIIIDEIHSFIIGIRGAQLSCQLERIKYYLEANTKFKQPQLVGLSASVGSTKLVTKWLSPESPTVICRDQSISKANFKIVTWNYKGKPDFNRTYFPWNDFNTILRGSKTLFFVKTRYMAELITAQLKEKTSFAIYIHHSSLSTNSRLEAEQSFAANTTESIIVATATLELGIDIGNIDQIVFWDMPSSATEFVQKLGRSGRSIGISKGIFICTTILDYITAKALVHLSNTGKVEEVIIETQDYEILFHQVLAIVKENLKISLYDIHNRLKNSYCISEITEAEFVKFIHILIEKGFLTPTGNSLCLGIKADDLFFNKTLTKRKFLTVFSNDQPVRVVYKDQFIGTLNKQWIANNLHKDMSFILNGKGWLPKRIELWKNEIIVEKASSNSPPIWYGKKTPPLSFLICQTIRFNLNKWVQELINSKLSTVLNINSKDETYIEDITHQIGILIEELPNGNGIWVYTFAGREFNEVFSEFLINCFTLPIPSINSFGLNFISQGKWRKKIVQALNDINNDFSYFNIQFYKQLKKMAVKKRFFTQAGNYYRYLDNNRRILTCKKSIEFILNQFRSLFSIPPAIFPTNQISVYSTFLK